MRRVFAADLLAGPVCGGRLRLIATGAAGGHRRSRSPSHDGFRSTFTIANASYPHPARPRRSDRMRRAPRQRLELDTLLLAFAALPVTVVERSEYEDKFRLPDAASASDSARSTEVYGDR